jgi:ATP-dependent Clp protease ATP-binding subunit ClpA
MDVDFPIEAILVNAMYERFTDRARKVMNLANQEAQRLGHEYIGTEHILLGLIEEGAGVAANVLKNLDIDLRKFRPEIEGMVQVGPDTDTKGKRPLTPRCLKAIEYATEEARNFSHNYVGTEHLLLGLIREQEGVAAQVLLKSGLKLEDVREEMLNLLGLQERPEDGGSESPALLGEDLNTAFQALPEKVLLVMKMLNDRISEIDQQKEEAVADQNFDRAARWRDKADKLRRQLLDAVENFLMPLVDPPEDDSE